MRSRLLAGCLLLLSLDISAAVIGTFDSRSGVYKNGDYFSLFPGSFLFGHASNALIADGHSLVNLDAGITAGSLASVDAVYLPVGEFEGSDILAASEATALADFVSAGGLLVVQADYSYSYANLLPVFGVTHTGWSSNGHGDVAVNGTFAPITNGPYGSVSTVSLNASGSFAMPGGGISLAGGAIGILEFGLGTAVFFGDTNMFDGPGNTDGYFKADNEALWRNTFAMTTAVPVPAAVWLFGSALIGLGWLRKDSLGGS